MSCEEMQDLISADLDGENDPEEAKTLKAHLAVCADCAGFSAELRRHKAALRRTSFPPLPEDLRLNLLAEARRLEKPSFASPEIRSRLTALLRIPALRYGFAAAGLLVAVVTFERVLTPAEESIPVDMLLAEHGRYVSALNSAQNDHWKDHRKNHEKP